jgi:hypothetical protein
LSSSGAASGTSQSSPPAASGIPSAADISTVMAASALASPAASVVTAPYTVIPTTSQSTTDGHSTDDITPYQCYVCHRLWQDPMVSPTCAHIFCNDCFPRSPYCPRCRQPNDFRAAQALSEANPAIYQRYRAWMEKLVLCDTCHMHVPLAKQRDHEQKECQESDINCVRISDRTGTVSTASMPSVISHKTYSSC